MSIEHKYKKYKNKYGENTLSNILYSANGYDAIYTAYNASKNCPKGDASCLVKEINEQKSDENSALTYYFKNRVMISDISFFKVQSGMVKALSN